MIDQQSINRQPLEDITAGAIDPQRDFVDLAERFEIIRELLGRDATEPIVADVAVDVDLGLGFSLGLHAVTVADVASRRSVENQRVSA
jgi:hypothetical protein